MAFVFKNSVQSLQRCSTAAVLRSLEGNQIPCCSNILPSVRPHRRLLCTKPPASSFRLNLPESSGDESRAHLERTFIAVKPDGVQRGLVGQIISRFEQRGYRLQAIKMVNPRNDQLEDHYGDKKGKDYYPRIMRIMTAGPMVCMIWEGNNVVKNSRLMMGPTYPDQCSPGTIRGDFCTHHRRNVIHGADSVEAAEREIRIWFDEREVSDWQRTDLPWTTEL